MRAVRGKTSTSVYSNMEKYNLYNLCIMADACKLNTTAYI